MTDELNKLREYLNKELKDLLELEKKNDLTEEGKGMLILLKIIYDHMGWKIEDSEVL